MYVSFTLAAPPSHELQALVPCVSSSMRVELCVFISKSRKWTFFLNNAPQSNGMCFPNLWSTDHVLAFEGRFLCWVDYFSGVMLFDFSGTRSPVLHFVLFPGGIEYPAEVRVKWCLVCPSARARCASSTLTMTSTLAAGEGSSSNSAKKSPLRFEWEPHRVIDLERLSADPSVPHQHLTEFPIISADDPDVLCYLLRKEEFNGEASMIVVDMNHAHLRSSTLYINRQSVNVKAHKYFFALCLSV
ncbi:uncharacterized protein [Aegilops tauschii subsp. strangulata]|uniref:uncharacterized protein n=1 Tax=Aegilops tauschii subsp. strangulata TaxID=200361 RepID=UPI003CC8CE2A